METSTIIVILAYYLGVYLGFRFGKYEENKKRIDEANKLKINKPIDPEWRKHVAMMHDPTVSVSEKVAAQTKIHKNWSKK